MPQKASSARAGRSKKNTRASLRLPKPGETLIRWVDVGGTEHRELASDIDPTSFHENRPVRKFGRYRDMTHFPGLYWAATTTRHLGFESWGESEWALLLDFDSAVTGIAAQPFQLLGRSQKQLWRHVPDYFASRGDLPPLVLDVRPEDRVDDELRELVRRTRETCAVLGWDYRLVHKVEPQLLRNVRFLSAYRRPIPDPLGLRPQILEAASEPLTVSGICDAVGPPEVVLPQLYRLCWLHYIQWDLTTQLRFYATKLVTVATPAQLKEAA